MQVASGQRAIIGAMIESHIVGGRQDVQDVQSLTYGQSITDACVGWDDGADIVRGLAAAVRTRRAAELSMDLKPVYDFSP